MHEDAKKREAPVAWVVERSCHSTWFGLVAMGCTYGMWALQDFFLYHVSVFPEVNTRLMACFLAFFVALVLGTARVSATTFNRAVMLTHMSCGTVLFWGLLGTDDYAQTLHLDFMWSLVFLQLTGLNIVQSTLCIAMSVVNASTVWSVNEFFLKDSDFHPTLEESVGLGEALLLWPCIYLFGALHTQRQWRDLYHAQRALATEKEAFESLLSMVCDAMTFWVAADGETVLRSDRQFDVTLGHAMQGARISEYLINGDRERMRRTLLGGSQSEKSPPVKLLPVTFLRACGEPLQVELFIVDRRKAFVECSSRRWFSSLTRRGSKDEDARRGFLIGLRMAEMEAKDPCFSPSISDREGPGLMQDSDLNEADIDVELGPPVDTERSNMRHSTLGSLASHRTMESEVSGAVLRPENLPVTSVRSICSWREGLFRPMSVTSEPVTLLSPRLPTVKAETCSRDEFERRLTSHPVLTRAAARDTVLAAISLVADEARGGALVAVAPKASFQRTFSRRRVSSATTGGTFGTFGTFGSGPGGDPELRSCDGGYMTDRLRGIHIRDPDFIKAFREFSEHSLTDCWELDHPDRAARGKPKDGAILLNTFGYRLKCGVKLLGLTSPGQWDGVGTKHEAAMGCAWCVDGAVALVRSEADIIHGILRRGDTLLVLRLEGHGPK